MVSPTLLVSKPVEAKATLVFAHGAGSCMREPMLNSLSDGLTHQGWRVVRFEFPYMARQSLTGRRTFPDKLSVLLDAYRSVVEAVNKEIQQPLLIGGKSMGGRIASLVANSLYNDDLIQGVVCLGYPFHPLKRPDQLRTEHLGSFSAPMLIVQGERDPMGGREEVDNYVLSDQIQIRWIADGDHSLSPRKRSGFTVKQNLDQAIRCVDVFMNDVCNR
ncbi:MAG: alpha/beta family hydrolase [Parasynechococcus sp.]|uniref:alpha/beta family hydrolase n=1 Tax=Parasynechococcus sp. TaxID=3101203 RepID=UPI003884FA9C